MNLAGLCQEMFERMQTQYHHNGKKLLLPLFEFELKKKSKFQIFLADVQIINPSIRITQYLPVMIWKNVPIITKHNTNFPRALFIAQLISIRQISKL